MFSSDVISEASALLLVVGILAFGIVAWATLTRVERLEGRAAESEDKILRVTIRLAHERASRVALAEYALRHPHGLAAEYEFMPNEPLHAAGDVHPFVADAVVSETEAVHGVAA